MRNTERLLFCGFGDGCENALEFLGRIEKGGGIGGDFAIGIPDQTQPVMGFSRFFFCTAHERVKFGTRLSRLCLFGIGSNARRRSHELAGKHIFVERLEPSGE